MSSYIPTEVRFPKNTFLLIRAIKSPTKDQHPNIIETNCDVPLPSKWVEQEVRLIHTADYTWSIPSNTIFTQQVIKTWKTKCGRWHLTLFHKKKMPLECPQISTKDILFSEKENRKVGNYNGITWIHSEKGFRYVIQTSDQYQTLLENKMIS